jgi:ubiquinone/menaquinone biosynthesis C-methylase UbiE
MRLANDPTIDYKALVRQAYDTCSVDYDNSRSRVAPPELNLLTSHLKKGAAVLDIGCGAGVPITSTLAKQYFVTGVDISNGMIARARSNVPDATFINDDIMSVIFPPSSFDAAVAFYSIFNIPRDEHPALLRRILGWLKPGGVFLATFSFNDDSSYTDDFFGVTMYWSNYGLKVYNSFLVKEGFKSLKTIVIGGGYWDAAKASKERHPLILAKKL